MNASDRLLMTIFGEALERSSPEERAAYLDAACGPDQQLRARVEALLRAHQQAGQFLQGDTSAPEPVAAGEQPPREGPGTLIGPYKLLQQIGEGGMGAVWMAEQQQPVRRMVAVKVIKPGQDNYQVLARFEAERQALALMDHPHIAKVLDAGTTQGGRPYFVMELVKGIPITRFCDERHLSPRERLELFIPVCQAVQHAHQKGIIHRDLKPSNVLVALYDGRPVPKVIDFGVAKAIGQKLTERTLFTAFGALVGTLEYMSPEQAELNQLDIDTRSDVYSLGVLLYELLTGTTPLDRKRLKEGAILELLRIIREVEPPRPSARLSSSDTLPNVAANRGTEPAKLTKLVRGELDWIVMKALEKDRGRRYETANAFARDVQRYLHDEPVEACPPSAGYKLHKFVRKNKRMFVTAAAFALLLVVGTVVSVALAFRATRAEHLAQSRLEEEVKARAEAEAVREFFVEDMIGWAAPDRKMGRPVTVDKVLDGAERAVGSRFQDQPLTEAAVRLMLGRVYYDLGQNDKAVEHLRRAQALFTDHLGSRHRRTLETMNVLGYTISVMGRHEDAARVLEEAAELGRQALGPEDHETLWSLYHLAGVRNIQGNHAAAENMLRGVLEVRQRLQGESHAATIVAKQDLGLVIWNKGENLQESKKLLEEAVQASRRFQGPDHPLTLLGEGNLAEVMSATGQETAAIKLLDQSLERIHKVSGPNHFRTISVGISLASCLADRPDPSDDDLTRALELSKKTLEIQNPETAPIAWNVIGIVHYRRGDWKKALEPLEKAAAGPHGYYKCRNDFVLAMTHEQLEEKDEARACYDRAAAWMDQHQPRTPVLLRFRAEAAAVLGIKDAPKPGSR
jgi:serine/threonine protein kinase